MFERGVGPLLCLQEEVGDCPAGAGSGSTHPDSTRFWRGVRQDPTVTAIEVDVAMGYYTGLVTLICEKHFNSIKRLKRSIWNPWFCGVLRHSTDHI